MEVGHKQLSLHLEVKALALAVILPIFVAIWLTKGEEKQLMFFL